MYIFCYLLLIIVPLIITPRSTVLKMRYSRMLYRHIRPWHVACGALSFVLTAATAIMLYQVPVLRFGWLWTLLDAGNPSSGNSSDPSTLYVIGSVTFMIIAIMMIFSVVPALAWDEEHTFRRPLARASVLKMALSVIIFGLLHIVMGIPLAAALAIIVAGVIFTITFRMSLARHEKKINDSARAAAQESGMRVEDIPDEDKDLFFSAAKTIALTDSALVHTVHNIFAFTLLAGTVTVLPYVS